MHSERIFETFAAKLADKFDPSLLPMDENESSITADQCRTEALSELIMKLRDLCSSTDLTDNFSKFDARLKREIDKIVETNWNYSEEKSKEVLQELAERISLPKVQSTDDIKPTLSMEFNSEWSHVIEEYFNNTKGPAANAILLAFIKDKVFESIGELLKDVVEAYTESENKLKLFLTELQVTEKKWKTQFEMNEKLLAERTEEKDELLGKNNEYELMFDQLQRELKSKENDIKSLKNFQEIEIANLKQQEENMSKEKALIIEDLTKKLNTMNNKIGELEAENQKLQNENIKNITQLKNHTRILEQTLDENKKKPRSSQQQSIISTLYTDIKTSLDDFKTLLNELNDNSKLKNQVLELQKEINEKEFAANKKMLDIRKEMGSQITETRLKHENDIRTMTAEIDSLKQSNSGLKAKLAQADTKYKIMSSKIEGIQVEKSLSDEDLKIKEKTILQFKSVLEQERTKVTTEIEKKGDVEMMLNQVIVDKAIIEEDIETLVEFICDSVKVFGKKMRVKEMIEKLRGEK